MGPIQIHAILLVAIHINKEGSPCLRPKFLKCRMIPIHKMG